MNSFSNKQQADYTRTLQKGLSFVRSFHGRLTGDTGSRPENIRRLKEELETADAIVIGAGAGLSTAAGYTYSGERFDQYFFDFKERLGLTDMYSGGFYPFPDDETRWAFWARNIYVNRYMAPAKPVYDDLLALVRDRDYFAITTNVDHCFQRAGFDQNRLFYTQGDYGLFQSADGRIKKTYDNEAWVREAMAAQRYAEFLRAKEGKHILFLELGVGSNTPMIIKYPFWAMTAENPNAVYACLNDREAVCPEQIRTRAVCVDGDSGKVLKALMGNAE